MCLYTRQTSKWEIPKVRNDDTKIPAQEGKGSEEMKDKKIDIIKQDINDNNSKKWKKKAIAKLATVETQKTEPGEKTNDSDDKPKLRNIDLDDNKKLKQNEVKQQFANSFIAEITQKNSVSKSGKGSSIRKKTQSVIRDNTLEEIPRDMPTYDSS